MKKKSNKYYVLLLLIITFAAPGVAAYLFYQHPDWLGMTKVNRGALLNPPVALNQLDSEKKWRIVFWSPVACEADCLRQLDILARVRLALGRKLYQVDQLLILSDKPDVLPSQAMATVKTLDFHVAQLSADEVNAHADLLADKKVFLLDPHNYLVLSYPALGNPDDIYKDLKLLLNSTEKSD